MGSIFITLLVIVVIFAIWVIKIYNSLQALMQEITAIITHRIVSLKLGFMRCSCIDLA